MTAEEKRPLAMLVTTLIVFSVYSYLAYHKYLSLGMTMEDSKFFAKAILIFLPFSIAAKIILYILYSIFNAILTGETEPSMTKDEFGKIIDLKASSNFYRIFIVGFLLAMVSQLLDWSIGSMFIIFFSSMFVGALVSEFSEYYYLKKGV